jgi:hypothetical protein
MDVPVEKTAIRQKAAAIDNVTGFGCSHAVRLSGREWLVAAGALLLLMGLGPMTWAGLEGFHPGRDYRVPYALSNDYWLYSRYCRRACAQKKILVLGDSVVWGHYVPADQTLAHYLSEFSGTGPTPDRAAVLRTGGPTAQRSSGPGAGRFANLGVDGTHPAALDGLLRHYGDAISGRTVVLHFNPLWLSSAKHDLQTSKEFHFNHAELVSQFTPKIPCYKATFTRRLGIAIRRAIPFSNWAAHVRTTYYEGMDLPAWTLAHPYGNPLAPLLHGLPEPGAPGEPPGSSWVERGAKKQDLAWVEFSSSLQWRFFTRAVELLQQRGNEVFVLIGPFNEHMLTEANALVYAKIKTQAQAWLHEHNIPCFAPPPLPAEHYVDASHPIGAGYALLAKELLNQPAFQSLLARQ